MMSVLPFPWVWGWTCPDVKAAVSGEAGPATRGGHLGRPWPEGAGRFLADPGIIPLNCSPPHSRDEFGRLQF